MPFTPRSVLEIERPRVFKPGKSAAVTTVVAERRKFSVSPPLLSLDVLKSEATMVVGFLQGSPLKKTVCCCSVVDVGQAS